MTFPVVETTATTSGTGTSSSPSVNLPSGIAADDLLVVLFRCGYAAPVGWPAGWTEIAEEVDTATPFDATAIAYRWADGTEGSTITLSITNSRYTAIAYRISGGLTSQAPELSTIASGSDDSPDPASLTPTGGAKDYLWLWLGAWGSGSSSPPSGTPTNYSSPIGTGDSNGVVRVASASRSLNA